jgi:hypothetical protein
MGSIGEIGQIIKGIFPIILSHHPVCSKFDSDTYGVLGWRICLGCSTTYPVAVMVVVMDILLRWDRLIGTWIVHKEWLLFAGVVLGSMQVIKYLHPPQTKSLRIAVKIALGLSIGGLTVWFFTFPAIFAIQFGMFITFAFILGFVASYRYNYLRTICAGCIYHGDWDLCYGFRTLNHHCRMRPKMSKQALRSIIFDRMRKRRWDGEDRAIRGCFHREEPHLDDVPPWLYDEPSYVVPWLPRTGLEVERSSDVPK